MNIFQHILNRSLAHVTRFSSKPQHFQESVAEHSFFVAYIATIMCELLEKDGEKIDKEKAIEMALAHDMEEMFSGDILGPFKHKLPEVSVAIRTLNQEMIKEVFADLPQDLARHFISLWEEEGQRQTTEAQIVKVADTLSLIAKCAEEVKVGNTFFQEMYESQLKLLQNYNAEWWEKIKNQILNTKY